MFLNAGAVNFAGAFGADFISDDAIKLGVNDGAEFRPETVEGIGFEAAFEDGVLDAQAPVFADFGHLVETLGVGDVVGDECEHLMGATAVAGEFARAESVGGKPVGSDGNGKLQRRPWVSAGGCGEAEIRGKHALNRGERAWAMTRCDHEQSGACRSRRAKCGGWKNRPTRGGLEVGWTQFMMKGSKVP